MDMMEIRRRIIFNQPRIESASGNVASFVTNMSAPLQKCVAEFSPVQEGENDPSPENIRPITGLDGLNLYQTGMNMWDITAYNGGTYNPSVGAKFNLTKSTTQWTDNKDGTFSLLFGSTWTYRTIIFPCIPGQNYYKYIKIKQSGNRRITYGGLDKDFNVISKSNNTTSTDITHNNTYDPVEARYYYYVITNGSSSNITITIENPMINLGSTKKDYVPYVGTAHPVTWSSAGTVYGGSVDLATGVLTVTKKLITYDGTESNWSLQKTGTNSYYYREATGRGVKFSRDLISNKYPFADITTNNTVQGVAIDGSGYLRVRWGAEDTLANFKASLAGTPLQVVATLTTPVTYQLDPVTLSSLKGQNNIWSNADGNVSVEYWTY